MRRPLPNLLWVALLAALAAGCTVPVQHGLDEGSANDVVTALERAGVGAEKAPEEGPGGDRRFTVRVAGGDAPRAMELLRSLGLPRGRRKGFAETYRQPSLVPTPTEERARYADALTSELERTLESLDGVVAARVHVVLPELDPFVRDGKPRVPAQAAVLLKVLRGTPAPADADVRKLVAGSVPGLGPDGVAVVVNATADAPTPAPLATVGLLRVSPASRGIIVGGLVIALLVIAGLALSVLVLWRRLQRLAQPL